MSFFARRFKLSLKSCFRGMRPWVWVFSIVVWAIPLITNGIHMSIPVCFAAGALFGAAFTLLWIFAVALACTLKDYKLYKILDENGFCEEYLKAFEQKRIVNKPFRLQNAAMYAEILERMGQPRDALNYLNSIVIPNDSRINERIGYFFVYVVSALKLGSVTLAEETVQRFEGDLEEAKRSPMYVALVLLVNLPLLYTNCAAGRVERAYEQTVAFMNSKDYKTGFRPMIDMDMMLLYELVALGKKDEAAKWGAEVTRRVEDAKPLFSSEKAKLFEDLNKALRGEIPL